MLRSLSNKLEVSKEIILSLDEQKYEVFCFVVHID